jgi:hypothetical protein
LVTQTSSFAPLFKSSLIQAHHVVCTSNKHQIQHRSALIDNISLNLVPEISSFDSSLLLSEESTESWRQYVPLVVSVGVIIDILLGSPLANLALGPMRRASEKGATGDSTQDGSDNGGGGGSLFSAFGGDNDGGKVVVDKSKERVDSEAIAQAALDKAMGTLELRRFLEENKTDEQRYEEVRKKIDSQMDELDESM